VERDAVAAAVRAHIFAHDAGAGSGLR